MTTHRHEHGVVDAVMRNKWTLGYIAFVSSVGVVLQVWELVK